MVSPQAREISGQSSPANACDSLGLGWHASLSFTLHENSDFRW
jgi:hypothetical protein